MSNQNNENSLGTKECIKKKLRDHYEKKVFGDLDVTKITIVYENLGQLSAIRCSESIDKFSKTLQTNIAKGKYPTLNPVIDEIYKHKTDSNSGLDSFVLFIENNSKFDALPVDNKNSFIEITTPIEIMWSNIGPFLEDDSIKITETSVQTPFFRKEL